MMTNGATGQAAPAISVIIPAHNRAARLPAVLDSVFMQADCPPFEVVVVDDASTDDTAAAVRAPARLVRLERNVGVATARQRGAEAARGSLLAFHDSDDFMLPGRLGTLARVMSSHPELAAVYANGVVERDGHPTGRLIVPDTLARQLDGTRFGVREIFRRQLPVYLQTALIRRASFEAIGGFDTTLARHADLELTCRLVLAAPAIFVDRAVFRYQLHGDNQTRDLVRLREGLVEVMRRLREKRPDAVAEIGAGWFRRRQAKHLYRIARLRRRTGDIEPAGRAIREAVALEPLSLRYRWLSWRI
jgi:glycosyltransferase involved in cell wall biosynthesis